MAGVDYVGSTDAPSIEGLEEDEILEAMIGWFHENFEDPARETPYETAEGGYQYIWGGPYDAEEEISGAFPDAPEELIARAVEDVTSDGLYEWAPSGSRIQQVEEDDDEPTIGLEDRLDTLAGQLEVVRGHVVQMLEIQQRSMDGQAPGIGHNNPPADDEPDLAGVLESIDRVDAELAKEDRENTADLEVLEVAEGRFRRFLSWITDLGKRAPTLMAEGALKAAGGSAFIYALKHRDVIISTLGTAADTIGAWVSNLSTLIL